MKISTPIGLGELYDKISILEIKSERISDEAKLTYVREELTLLKETATKFPIDPAPYAELKNVNARLWEIEDEIRVEESRREFGEKFIQLARSIYTLNDQRSKIKHEINITSGSDIIEVKSYKS